MNQSTTIVILACENGHTLDYKILSNIKDRINDGEDPFSGSINYCTECGGETQYRCGECGYPITDTASLASTINLDLDSISLLNYCPHCGEAFPWISPVEKEETRDGEFLEIDSAEISGFFYQELVNEINLCYRVQTNEATFVLYRKLLESLIYDILSDYCDPSDEIGLYYDTDRKRRRNFSTLLDSLEKKSDELDKFSDPIDDHEFQEQITEFKEDGDSSAHSKENLVTDEEIEMKSEEATHVAKVLFDLRRRVAAGIETE